MSARRTAAAVLLWAVASLATVGSGAAARPIPPAADLPPRERRLYVVADSVALGAPAQLAAAFPGWQVTVDGTPGLFTEQLESKHVRARMSSSPEVFGDVAVVATGHNFPFWDPPRFDRSVDSMVATLRAAGATRIYWVLLREVTPEDVTSSAWRQAQSYIWYLPIVNAHLRAALARHPELTVVDWAAVADGHPEYTNDAIHLNALGATRYAGAVAATVLSTLHRPLPGTVTRIAVSGATGAPAAVAVNIAAVDGRRPGFVTAYPCAEEPPFVASTTFATAGAVSAAAIVPVSTDGTICLRSNEATHLVVDRTGTFPADAGVAGVAPTRLIDTREGAGVRAHAGVPLRVPLAPLGGAATGARAVAVTVTITGSDAAGFASVTPCGRAGAGTANVNFAAAATVANLAVVEPGEDEAICVTSNVDAHVVVDASAVFGQAAHMRPLDGVRLLDTRLAASGGGLGRGGVVRVHVAGSGRVPADASGVVLNLTGVAPAADGYLTAFPCSAGAPPTASLSLIAGADRGNLVIVAPDASGDVCVRTFAPTDVVVDLFGWFGSSFTGGAPERLLDTRVDLLTG